MVMKVDEIALNRQYHLEWVLGLISLRIKVPFEITHFLAALHRLLSLSNNYVLYISI